MSLADKRIFIIEDDAYNLAIMSSYLRQARAYFGFDRWGYNTIYQLTNFLPIDIILLDLMLPNNVTGYDVFNQIRVVPGLKHIPVLAVTAADPSIEMEKARQAGFRGYIAKPFPRSFTQLIAQAIDGHYIWFTHDDDF